MTDRISALANSAGAAAAQGRWAEAERLWREVRALAPTHVGALYSLSVHALQRGDPIEATALLGEALTHEPRSALLRLTLATAHREAGDPNAEWASINDALICDPYFVPALLAKGDHLRRRGRLRAAAAALRNALVAAGPEPLWQPSVRPALEAAQALVAEQSRIYLDYLVEHGVADRADPDGRWREAASLMAGTSTPYHSVANQLSVPRLPAIPFYDRSAFPWAEALERSTDAIRQEFLSVWTGAPGDFGPYINYQPGDPVGVWRDLNQSTRWSTFHLWRAGEPVAANQARCPASVAALEHVELAALDQLCPNVMFSVLAPNTVIPPHHGETNARLVVHLPLIVPPGCEYRVGFENRRWEEGRLLIFDDTIEHTARNDGTAHRAVLIFDVWNPLLSPGERELVRALAQAARDFLSAEG